ncbi:hypothetical protein [Pseudophaeobacter flagellatus]|uniref:hypothetical protein n=1 Tax=Pseudophaeobacter flagellatus TaxID=2899119 RepID=UPI001E2FE57E|nr:hypothetical protein [Pseudophaeobacter flagellatus]MCD9148067.1 hypothetical protein [Pseudophaeobacter flagellatus]
MPDLTLFHTAEVHVASFDALAPQAQLAHVVRPDWLTRAQTGMTAELRLEISAAIEATSGPVLCSCTTIGAVAEAAGATRIDWPMMQRAAEIGGPVMMAYCLDSTRAPSTALLERAFAERGSAAEIRTLPLPRLWHHFTNGDSALFHAEIASQVETSLALAADTSCVVLAQASMAGAKDLLLHRTVLPVLASPAIAMETLLPLRS